MNEIAQMWSQNSESIIAVTLFFLFIFKGQIMSVIMGIHNVSVDDLNLDLASKEVELLDVRTVGEFQSGHVAQAKNIPLHEISSNNKLIANLDKEKPIYLICRSGNRSLSAAVKLKRLGFDVTNVRGGMTLWQMKSLPTTL